MIPTVTVSNVLHDNRELQKRNNNLVLSKIPSFRLGVRGQVIPNEDEVYVLFVVTTDIIGHKGLVKGKVSNMYQEKDDDTFLPLMYDASVDTHAQLFCLIVVF